MLWTLMIACVNASPLAPATAPPGFWDHWGDGKAELNRYDLVQPRYGNQVEGELVWIFVTETMSMTPRVKTDGKGMAVIKLNEARDFNTGVYDYNLMTSVFASLTGEHTMGTPTKVSFSSQEWCGMTHDQLVVTGEVADRTVHSYFEGEADQQLTQTIPPNAAYADAFPLLVRGMQGEWVKRGESMTIPTHPRLQTLRLLHQDGAFASSTVSRSSKTANTTVPLGTFETERWDIKTPAGAFIYQVEVQTPHRIIAMEGPNGEKLALTHSTRMDYWNRSRPTDEPLRRQLGLE